MSRAGKGKSFVPPTPVWPTSWASGLPAAFQSGGARGYQVASMEPKAEAASTANFLFRKQDSVVFVKHVRFNTC